MPRFPFKDCEDLEYNETKQKCSDQALTVYLLENTKYSAVARSANVEGICVVQFAVEKDGTLSNIDLVRDIGSGCGEEAVRVVEKMNADGIKWMPGKQRDRTVRVRFTLPFKFDLGDRKKENMEPTTSTAVDRNLRLSSFTVSPNPVAGNYGGNITREVIEYNLDPPLIFPNSYCAFMTVSPQSATT
jgi:TonB family protein